VVEDEFLVWMGVDEFIFEVCVEVCVYGCRFLVLGFENNGEGDVFVLLLASFLREAFGPEDFGVRVGFVPGPEEDMVLRFLVSRSIAGRLVEREYTSMSVAAIYFTSPSRSTVCLTSGVRAVGEKTATLPDVRRTDSSKLESRSVVMRRLTVRDHTECPASTDSYATHPIEGRRDGCDALSHLSDDSDI
jgi:hypothetical protein